jgi:hypothetical protein
VATFAKNKCLAVCRQSKFEMRHESSRKTTATKMSSDQQQPRSRTTLSNTGQLFANATAPQFTYKEYTTAQMLRNYTGYYQHSIAFAQECIDRVAREHGNYC